MLLLVLGLLLFFSIHLVPAFQGSRGRLVGWIGESWYKTIFSLVSATGFILIVMGKGNAPLVLMFDPPAWGSVITKIVMLPAFILLIASYYPCNIKSQIKHPMLIGVLLWSTAHLLANGDQASLLLFGSFALYAVIDLFSVFHRSTESAATSGTESSGFISDMVVVIVGILIYFLVYKIHGVAFAPI